MIRLVVDTNILFSFFWKNSVTRELLMQKSLELYSPEFALKEIQMHSSEIIKKTNLSKKEFEKIKEELFVHIQFVSLNHYSKYLKKALILDDKDDIDFLALAFYLDCQIWSNDYDFKKQKSINILTTKDLIVLLS